MVNKILKIVLGIIAVSFLAKLAFGLTMIFSIHSFLAKESARYPDPEPTPFVAGGIPTLPDIAYSKDLARPLLMSDRARLSHKLKGVLGHGTDGWKLRYNTRKDAIALRPDKADCLRYEQTDCYTVATNHKAEIFYKGKKRLYVHVRLRGGGFSKAIEKDEFDALDKQFKNSSWNALRPGWAKSEYLKSEWKKLDPWKGFTLERMENHGGQGAYFLKATLEGEGDIIISMLSNAPLEDVKNQLAAMDLDLLHAMVAPVPFGGLNSQEEYIASDLEERRKNKRFEVLSDAAISDKVAAMPSEARIRLISQLFAHAKRHNRSPIEYDILYHPLGAQGLQDTRDFLSGRIGEDDPRFGILEKEQRRSSPIGSCLLSTVGELCREEAEYLRMALEVRRQSAAKDASKPAPVLPEVTEQTYLEEMAGLERQMNALLQSLAAKQAGD